MAGDGSFEVTVRTRKYGNEVGLTFSLSQHIRDAHLLGVIANYLDCGKVYTSSTGLNCYLKVQSFSPPPAPRASARRRRGRGDVYNKIIPFFDQYLIFGVKYLDYLD